MTIKNKMINYGIGLAFLNPIISIYIGRFFIGDLFVMKMYEGIVTWIIPSLLVYELLDIIYCIVTKKWMKDIYTLDFVKESFYRLIIIVVLVGLFMVWINIFIYVYTIIFSLLWSISHMFWMFAIYKIIPWANNKIKDL